MRTPLFFPFVLLLLLPSLLAAQPFKSDPVFFDGLGQTVKKVYYTTDGRLVAGGIEGKVVVYAPNATSPSLTMNPGYNVTAMAIDDEHVATGSFITTDFHVYSLKTGKAVATPKPHPGGETVSISFVPGSPNLLISGGGGPTNRDPYETKLWDWTTGEVIRVFQKGDPGDLYPSDIDVSPDGKLVAIGYANSKSGFKIFEVETGKLVHSVTTKDIYGVAFSPDGKLLAITASDERQGHEVALYNVASGNRVWANTGSHTDFVMAVAFSPDMAYIASVGYDRAFRAKVLDAKTGKEVQSLGGRGNKVLSVAWDPDGSGFVTANTTSGNLGNQVTIAEWKLKNPPTLTSTPMFTPPTATAPPAGLMLATWGNDGFWYPAKVEGGKILYLDGDQSTVAKNKVKAFDWTVGTRVNCNWKNGGKYYWGKIGKIDGEDVYIRYDDGDTENGKIKQCRCQ